MNDSLDLRSVSVRYGARLALDSVTLTVPHGAQIAIVGPNGAGKYRDPIAYVPQREEVDWRFPVTVFDVVAMGRYGRGRWLKGLTETDRTAVRDSLARLDIAGLAHRPIGELSGGQQQRVFLARALAQEPHVLLLDEPFTGVDVATREATLELLSGLRARSVTVLVSTHDLDLAASRFDQVVLLNRRLIHAGAPGEVFTEEHLQQAFSGQMVVVDGRIIVVDQCCCGGDGGEHQG
jgi:manganese/iron transport system ATP-binding protein